MAQGLKFTFSMPDDESLAKYISIKGEKGDYGGATKTSQLENDSDFTTNAALNAGLATKADTTTVQNLTARVNANTNNIASLEAATITVNRQNGGTTGRWYKITTLGANSNKASSVSLNGRLGTFNSNNFAHIDLTISAHTARRMVGDCNIYQTADVLSNADILVYDEGDNTYSVYLKIIGNWCSVQLDAHFSDCDGEFDGTYVTAEPSGTLVASLSTAPYVQKNINGVISADINGDAQTVNGHTVESDVPFGAVFTDTVYDDSAIRDELDTKAGNNEVASTYATKEEVQAVASGSPLVASSTSEMTDTTKTYVNTTDGKWYYYDGSAWVAGGTYQSTGVEDNSIENIKLAKDVRYNIESMGIDSNRSAFVEDAEYNLFDYNSALIGKDVNTNDGSLWNNTNSMASDFIPVIPNETYITNEKTRAAFYDKNKACVTAFTTTDSIWTTVMGKVAVVVPEGCYYFRGRWAKTNTNAYFYRLVNGYVDPNTSTDTKLYDFRLNGKAKNTLIRELSNGKMLPIANSALRRMISSNMLDKALLKDNTAIEYRANQGRGREYAVNNYTCSDYIPVEAGASYICSRDYNTVLYDENYQPISGFHESDSESTLWHKIVQNTHYQITIPEGAAFIRTTYAMADSYKYFYRVLEDSDLAREITDDSFNKIYNIKLDDDIAELVREETQAKRHEGKVWNCLGDSITSTDYTLPTWWQMIADETGITVNQYGISGTALAHRPERHLWDYHFGRLDPEEIGYVENDPTTWDTGNCMVERYTKMSDNADIVTVLASTNDDGIPLGTWDSTDTATFYGALNVLMQGLLNKYAGKIVAFFTPPKLKTGHNSDVANASTALDAKSATDTLSVQLRAEAIKRKCAQYGIPCLDLYNGAFSGADSSTIYYRDTWHPSAQGQERLRAMILNFIDGLLK